MNYIGLIFEIIFFIAATYGYLFAIGKFQSKDPAVQKKANAFRAENGKWLRIGCLLVMALMAIEIFLNVKGMLA